MSRRIRSTPSAAGTAVILLVATAGCCICRNFWAVDASSLGPGGGAGSAGNIPVSTRGRGRPAARRSPLSSNVDNSDGASSDSTRKNKKGTTGNIEEDENESREPIMQTPEHQPSDTQSEEVVDNDDSSSNTNNKLEPSQVLPHNNGGSIVTGLFLALKANLPPARQIARLGLTGCQIGILYVLMRATWQAVTEAIEEISEDMDGLNGGGGGVREEHDKTWLKDEGVDEAIQASSGAIVDDDDMASEGEAAAAKLRGWGMGSTASKKHVASYEAASDLARRLRASGMPMVLPDDLAPHLRAKSPNSVQHVLKSLTKTEGRLLSSALLSPADDGDDGIFGTDETSNQERHNRISGLWNDIGGLNDVKDGLLDLVFPLLMNQSDGEASGDAKTSADSYYGGLLSNPPGVLLYGPPGCGKTTLVRALASTANARVLCVTPSTMMRKYVGETELQVRALFSLARKIAPCIIFVDEVDGLFRERGSGGGGGGGEHDVSRDLKTEFMQLWDGIRSKKVGGRSEQILIIGATNRPFDVDPGFLRRMPRSFFVGLPDRAARVAVLKSILKHVPLSSDFDVDAIATATEYYAPSDLKELLRTAALVPLREARFKAINQARQGPQESSELPPATQMGAVPALRPLTTADVLGAVAKVSPTMLNPQYVAALSDYASRSGGVRNANNPPASYGAASGDGDQYSGSKKPYQHPSGYYVHKAEDGSFLADIGTFSTDGHHPSSSGLGVDDNSSSDDEGFNPMGRGLDGDSTYDEDDDDSDDYEL